MRVVGNFEVIKG